MKSKKNNDETSDERKTSKRYGRAGFSKFCAFWGVTFAALCFAVNGILQIVTKLTDADLKNCMTGIDFVSKFLLLIAVAVPAYGYVNNKKLIWKIVYAAAIVFYACFCVLRLF